MLQLDPSSKNELGKGTLPPAWEAEYLADGFVFAARVPGTRAGTVVVCKRPIAEAVTEVNRGVLRLCNRKRVAPESVLAVTA